MVKHPALIYLLRFRMLASTFTTYAPMIFSHAYKLFSLHFWGVQSLATLSITHTHQHLSSIHPYTGTGSVWDWEKITGSGLPIATLDIHTHVCTQSTTCLWIHIQYSNQRKEFIPPHHVFWQSEPYLENLLEINAQNFVQVEWNGIVWKITHKIHQKSPWHHLCSSFSPKG